MHVPKHGPVSFDPRKTVLKVGLSLAERLYLGPGESDSGFERLENLVLMQSPPVGADDFDFGFFIFGQVKTELN